MLISEQLTGLASEPEPVEFGWRFNPLEHRNDHGEWSRDGGTELLAGMKWGGPGADYADPPADRVNQGGLKGSTNPFVKKYGLSADNIVKSYDASTPDERDQGQRWYSDAHDVALAIGKGDADKGAAMLSAFSVQTDWATDVMNAASTFAKGKVPEHGVGITGAVRARAQAILDAPEGSDLDHLFPAIGSAKTRSFYHLIRNGGDLPGDTEGHVVIDRHALSVAAGRRLTSAETQAPTYAQVAEAHPDWSHEQAKAYIGTFPADPTSSGYSYSHIADMYRAAAKQVSERDGVEVSPHQMQAITWMHQLHANDADDSHLVELAADAVRGGGKFTSVPGAATAKGRASAMSKRWAAWASYAAAHQVPVHTGTTAMTSDTISGQVIALAGWRAAWRHELRGPDGKWMHSGEALTSAEGRLSHVRAQIAIARSYPDAWPVFNQVMGDAQHSLDAGDSAGARKNLRIAGKLLDDHPSAGGDGNRIRSADLRDLASQLTKAGPIAPSPGSLSSAQAVKSLITKAANALPGMFGSNEHLDWDGKDPTILQSGPDPETLAIVDWTGHINIASVVADGLKADQADPAAAVGNPSDYTVPLHEMIHAVVPAGENRYTNGDMLAYQDYGTAQAEEGFTELGTIQHAGDFFDQVGVADRQAAGLGRTMGELADERSTPAAIRSGRAWGHYPAEAKQAFEWTSMIAQMRTGQGEDSEATRDAILDIADQVNAVGAKAKIEVMARHVAGDMSADPSVLAQILPGVEDSIRSDWGSGTAAQKAFQHARARAQQRAAEIEAERRAA